LEEILGEPYKVTCKKATLRGWALNFKAGLSNLISEGACIRTPHYLELVDVQPNSECA